MKKNDWVKWLVIVGSVICILASSSTAITNVKGWFQKGTNTPASTETSQTQQAIK